MGCRKNMAIIPHGLQVGETVVGKQQLTRHRWANLPRWKLKDQNRVSKILINFEAIMGGRLIDVEKSNMRYGGANLF